MQDPIHSAPRGQATTPKPVFWFRVYTGGMTAIYGLCALVAPVFFYLATKATGEEATALQIQAVVFLAVGVPLAVVFALPFVLPRRRWVWVYSLVLICIGYYLCIRSPKALPPVETAEAVGSEVVEGA